MSTHRADLNKNKNDSKMNEVLTLTDILRKVESMDNRIKILEFKNNTNQERPPTTNKKLLSNFIEDDIEITPM